MSQQLLAIKSACSIDLHPVIKWVGGKRQLLHEIKKYIPSGFNRYFEPFIGGGAVFFSLQQNGSYISDVNEELVNLYCTIKYNAVDLLKDLRKHQNTKEYFLQIRNLDREKQYKQLSDVQKASRFIYMNRTCFNGLYRVNSKGEFNVPFGAYHNPRIVDEENLLACSELLKQTEIRCADFSAILDVVQPNDFVYFDPPYIPLNATSSFTSYTKDGFDVDMQYRLRDVCNTLHHKDVKFLVSNSDTPLTRELYSEYNIETVFASRAINCKASGRGKITEVLIRNY